MNIPLMFDPNNPPQHWLCDQVEDITQYEVGQFILPDLFVYSIDRIDDSIIAVSPEFNEFILQELKYEGVGVGEDFVQIGMKRYTRNEITRILKLKAFL